jgi:DNA polymerase kappa
MDEDHLPGIAGNNNPARCQQDTDGEHQSLKYHLLGPSLTKAGQDSVDQTKVRRPNPPMCLPNGFQVSEIIYNASKGSKFFNNEESKDKVLTSKIERILKKRADLEKLDLNSDRRRADEYITELELSRDLSQTLVHIDCDAFYAAVEELDRPELKNVPMAVGKGVLTTCNYHARKFGCRSGMAGFVAMKLCPELICLPLNFAKYTAKAKEVREILAEYDPRFQSASIDEAYLNITDYCEQHEMDPQDAVSQLREEIAEKTKITVSAGIAANAQLAKICSNMNKPNGQFFLPSDRAAIMNFMSELPTRKVNGVGRVFERELDAIGVKTCGDIYPHRMYLSKLFGDKAFQFLMNCYLGLGRTSVRPAEEHVRKSVGTESTFREMSGKGKLREKLHWIAEELEKDMKRAQVKGRTLVLKVKLHTYEVYTRQHVPPKAVSAADELYNYALPMLAKVEKEIPDMKLRLMGLRCTHLISTKKAGVNFFGVRQPTERSANGNEASDESEWEQWPEEEFEQAARQEREDDMNEVEQLSQEDPGLRTGNIAKAGHLIEPNPGKSEPVAEDLWDCPICRLPQKADEWTFNSHIDQCLSKQTIKEVVQSISASATEEEESPAATSTGKKGKRKMEHLTTETKERKKQRPLFFG